MSRQGDPTLRSKTDERERPESENSASERFRVPSEIELLCSYA